MPNSSGSLHGQDVRWEELRAGGQRVWLQAREAVVDRGFRSAELQGVRLRAGALHLEMHRGSWEARSQRLQGSRFVVRDGPLRMSGDELEVDLVSNRLVARGVRVELGRPAARGSAASAVVEGQHPLAEPDR